jgi:hypothetical protein
MRTLDRLVLGPAIEVELTDLDRDRSPALRPRLDDDAFRCECPIAPSSLLSVDIVEAAQVQSRGERGETSEGAPETA